MMWCLIAVNGTIGLMHPTKFATVITNAVVARILPQPSKKMDW